MSGCSPLVRAPFVPERRLVGDDDPDVAPLGLVVVQLLDGLLLDREEVLVRDAGLHHATGDVLHHGEHMNEERGRGRGRRAENSRRKANQCMSNPPQGERNPRCPDLLRPVPRPPCCRMRCRWSRSRGGRRGARRPEGRQTDPAVAPASCTRECESRNFQLSTARLPVFLWECFNNSGGMMWKRRGPHVQACIEHVREDIPLKDCP